MVAQIECFPPDPLLAPPLAPSTGLEFGITTTEQVGDAADPQGEWLTNKRYEYVLSDSRNGVRRYWRWRPFDESWVYEYDQSVYELDEAGRIVRSTFATSPDVPAIRSTFTYQDDGLLALHYAERRSGEQWGPGSRQIYVYRSDGQVESRLIEWFEYGKWQVQRQIETDYDDQGYLMSCVVTPGWYGSSRDQWIVVRDAAGRRSELIRQWSRNGGSLENSERTVFRYGDHGVAIQDHFYWDEIGKWFLWRRFEVEHDEGTGKRSKATLLVSDSSGDRSIPLRLGVRVEFSYDSDGFLSARTEFQFNQEANTWENYHRTLYTYAGRPTPAETSPVKLPLRLSLAPNPAGGLVRLHFAPAVMGDVHVDVLDLLGRRLQTVEVGGGTDTVLDLSSLTPGLYLLHATTEVGVVSQLVTVAR